MRSMPPKSRSLPRRARECERRPSYAPLPRCGDGRDEHHDRRQPKQCESCLTHVRLPDRRSICVLRVRRPLPQYMGRYRGGTLGCTGGEPSAFPQGGVKRTQPSAAGSVRINADLGDCSSRRPPRVTRRHQRHQSRTGLRRRMSRATYRRAGFAALTGSGRVRRVEHAPTIALRMDCRSCVVWLQVVERRRHSCRSLRGSTTSPR